MLPRSLLLSAAAVLAAGGATAQAAPKTAITYIKGADVKMVAPDGSDAHLLTHDGTEDDPYRRPNVARDGTVWTLRGWDLIHLAADGHRIGTFPLPRPKDSHGLDLEYVPEFLDLSPDGKKAAWSVTNTRCPMDDPCYSDGITGIVDLASGQQIGEKRGITETAFVDDGRLVGIDPDWAGEVRMAPVGAGEPVLWYSDAAVFGPPWGTPRHPVITADRKSYATLRTVYGVGVGVFVYRVTADGSAAGFAPPPQHLCVVNKADASHAGPAWSPDGTTVVVAQTNGLASYDFTGVHGGDECATKVGFTALDDAPVRDPDWGVVPGTTPDPPSGGGPGTPAPPAPGGPAPGGPAPSVTPKPAPVVKGGGATASGPKLTLAAQKLSAILKSGLKVKLTGARPGKGKVVVKAGGGRVVATKAVTVPASGALSATVKLSPAGRKALKRARSATLTVSLGGATATLKVKR
jgi:hypothetical protein